MSLERGSLARLSVTSMDDYLDQIDLVAPRATTDPPISKLSMCTFVGGARSRQAPAEPRQTSPGNFPRTVLLCYFRRILLASSRQIGGWTWPCSLLGLVYDGIIIKKTRRVSMAKARWDVLQLCWILLMMENFHISIAHYFYKVGWVEIRGKERPKSVDR